MDESSPESLPPPNPVPPVEDAPESPSLFYGIFVGPDGLRAGWRFLIYCAMCAALYIAFMTVIRLIPGGGLRSVWALLVGESVFLISALAPALVMSKIEQRPFGAYGLPPSNAFGRFFWLGTAWGILGLTLLMVMMRAAGVFYFGHRALHGTRVLKFALFYAAIFLIVGLFEEFWLRGYTQFTLTKGVGFWPAAIILSIAFGAIHLGNQGEALIGALAAAVIGLFFCLTLRRTGTLWFAVGFHAAWDWGETYLFSVPDSGISFPGQLMRPTFQGSRWLTGGSVGPEGSILVFIALAILWALFSRTYREAKYLG